MFGPNPLLWNCHPAPTHPPEPLDPPQGILQKKSFFFFLVRITNVKNTTQVAKFCSVPGARAPTTYLPGTRAPGPPLPSPCTPSLLETSNFDASCEICSVPGARHRALGPPPSPSLGPRGGPRGLLSCVWNQPSHSFQTAIQPLRPPPTLSCNQGPWFTALSTRPAPVGTPPPHRASFKTHHFSSFLVRVRNIKNTTQVAKFAPSLNPVPLPPTPPAPKPLDPHPLLQPRPLPPCPPGQLRWVPPHPTGHPSKNIIFLFFVRVRNVKNTTQVRAPTTYPPGTEALGPHPSPNLGCRGPGLGASSLVFGPNPFFGTAIQPLRIPQPSPATKALGLPPCPPGLLRPWGPCPYHLPPQMDSKALETDSEEEGVFRLNLRQHQPPREHLPQTSKAKIAWQRCFQLKITRANDVRPHSGETHDRPNLCIARHGDRRRSRSRPRAAAQGGPLPFAHPAPHCLAWIHYFLVYPICKTR